MAYPHVESKSTVVNFLKKGWNFITGGTSATEGEVTLPSQDVMQSEALNFYLDAHKSTLSKFSFPSSFKADIATNEIMTIFNSLRFVTHCMDDCGYVTLFLCSKLSEVSIL